MSPDAGDRAFRVCAAFALALHAGVLLLPPALRGGADLLPHLRLIELMAQQPGLRSVYAPAYHVLGALLLPIVGLAAWPKLFAALAAVAWIGGFRSFQRAAGLPATCAALFALLPYGFTFSWCLPKVEAAGYGLAFFGLGLLIRGRALPSALVLAATFSLHTASAIFFGITGGVIALARRDLRALAALAAGTLGAAPLLGAHVAAGCTLAEALLLSHDDYLRVTERWSSLPYWDLILVLANPLALGLAVRGAPALGRHSRALAAACAVLVLLYLNELWLSPFATRTTLDLLRGLSTLAFPVAIAGGVALAGLGRWTVPVLAGCALWALLACASALPRVCHVREVRVEELRDLSVERCTFRWHGPAIQRQSRPPA